MFIKEVKLSEPEPCNMNGHSFVIHVQKTVYQDSPFYTTDCNNHCEANCRITKSREKSHQEAESHKKHDLNIHNPLNGQKNSALAYF